MAQMLRKTALYDKHCLLGAKMAPFGGFEMPIQYDGIIKEHNAARRGAAIFDTCHMGECIIKGSGAEADLNRILTCSVDTLETGRCRYGFICNPEGGVIDDQIVYRLESDEFFLVVNAGTQDADFKWIADNLGPKSRIIPRSEQTAKLDVQGPGAPRIIQSILEQPIDAMRFYRFEWNSWRSRRVLISRTGYTGEIGFELYIDVDLAGELWDAILACGAVPAGLGARDTLRLEMGMPLYGHELDSCTNPMQTGFNRAIDASKEFIGSEAVLDPQNAPRKLCGIRLSGRRAARSGDTVVDATEQTVGVITSGSFSPMLQTAIALAYIDTTHAKPGFAVQITTGKLALAGVVEELPFYKDATGRKPMRDFLD